MNDEQTHQHEDDTEAHRFYSDREVKHDVQPVVSEEQDADDTEAHRVYSDRDVKHDVQPVVSEEQGADDTEGHGRRAW